MPPRQQNLAKRWSVLHVSLACMATVWCCDSSGWLRDSRHPYSPALACGRGRHRQDTNQTCPFAPTFENQVRLSQRDRGWLGPQYSTGAERERLAKRDFENLRIADVSLDCNWRGMKKALGPILKKASGVDLLARQALVERVRVSGFGAVGGRPSWREVFPIRVISGMGDGANLPGYRDSIIEVRHCVVEIFYGAGHRHGVAILHRHHGEPPGCRC